MLTMFVKRNTKRLRVNDSLTFRNLEWGQAKVLFKNKRKRSQRENLKREERG